MNHTSFDLARSVERDAARVGRLMEDVARSMQEGGGPLTDQQRALMWGIVADLVRTAVCRIVEALAAAETPRPPAPIVDGAAAIMRDAPDERLAEIAVRTGLLRDGRLVRLVFARVQAHRVSEIMRPPRSGTRDGQPAAGPESLLDAADLAHYHDRELRRTDAYGDPRLPLDELPADMFDAVHWQAAAALRTRLLERAGGDAAAIDDAVEAATARILRQPPPLREAERLDRHAAVPPEALVQALARGDVFLFLMLLGQISGLSLSRLQTAAFGRGDLEFATLSRALDLPREIFAELHLLVCQQSAGKVRDARALAEALRNFDAIDPAEARDLLRLWRRHPRYAGAIRHLSEE